MATKKSIELVYGEKRACVVWYEGTSDAMVEKAALLLLGLPSPMFLLRDLDGELVPIASSLPPGVYQVVDYTDRSQGYMNLNHLNARCDPKRPYTATSTPLQNESVKRMKKHTPMNLMKEFLEIFTIPLAPDDVVNFIPNHGDFGIDRLYTLLVSDEFIPQDRTTFYKLASSSIVLDRQRVIRYYKVGNSCFQLSAIGKGPLLRAYVHPNALQNEPHLSMLQAFVSALGIMTVEQVETTYRLFLRGFTPISRAEYINHD